MSVAGATKLGDAHEIVVVDSTPKSVPKPLRRKPSPAPRAPPVAWWLGVAAGQVTPGMQTRSLDDVAALSGGRRTRRAAAAAG